MTGYTLGGILSQLVYLVIGFKAMMARDPVYVKGTSASSFDLRV